ncbi:MAG: cellulase family glycosylhydrolase [Chloroflexaceae bacterium]|nr:cellulase family glycosylhydrolase [Chloroflexaceae bacterium]
MQKILRMVLCGVLLLLAACGDGAPPAVEEAPATPTRSVVPTAYIRSTPVVANSVIIPTLTSTPEVITSTPVTTTSAVQYQPVLRVGPGGLPYPLRLNQLNYGVVGHFYYTNRQTAYQKARDGGFQWIRQQVHWRDIEDRSGAFFWDELNKIVDEANQAGLLVMISVVRSPAWYTTDGSDGMPDDPATLARFVGAMASHFKGRIHAIQIWNEQNLAHENGGFVSLDDAGQYVELLAASYTAIKAVDPTIIVVSGGLAPTRTNIDTVAVPDIDYLRAMYSYNNSKIRDYFDVQGVHPFGFANPPETAWPDNPSTTGGWNEDETFYFRHIENTRAVMKEFGLMQHQVWITEFGWATPNNSPGYEYGNLTSFETQRDYLVRAMEMVYKDYTWVSNMFVWNLNFTVVQEEAGVDRLHEQGSFSIFNYDWSARPAYLGIQQFY